MGIIKIKLAVDKSQNCVLFADAGSDFANVLLGFLTVPLSVVQFCAGTSSPGCLTKLCDSVNHLRNSELLKVDTCPDMLLTPTHYDEFNEVWNTETFLRGKEQFVIGDDWKIKPASTSSILLLPQTFSSDGICHGFEEVHVCVGWAEAKCLLKASLSSDRIFTNAFLSKGNGGQASSLTVKPSINQKIPHPCSKDSGSSPESKIKLFYDRHEKKVMYAECNHEFVDLLLGFLTYPVGRVIKNIDAGTSSHLSRNFTNLYNSAIDLDASRFLDRMPELTCYCCHPVLVEDRVYLVDDDLLIQQASGMSVMKHWCMRDKAKVLEMDIAIGKQEAVALLQAVLTSKTALTDVFNSRLERQSSLQKMTDVFNSRLERQSSLQKMTDVFNSRLERQIFAKLPSGKTITVEVSGNDTIADVKSKIREKVRIKTNCRHELVHRSRYLKDSCTVAQCNLVRECTVTLEFH